MKKLKLILPLLLTLLANPVFGQVPERSRLIVPSSTSSSWFRGVGGASCAAPMLATTADPTTGMQMNSNAVRTCVAGVNVFQVSAGVAVLTNSSIGVTPTTGVAIQNATAAAAGSQQMSPRLLFDGRGWKTDATAASQVVSVSQELLPIEGAAAPTANFLWKYSVNGGAYGTIMTLGSNGALYSGSGGTNTPYLDGSAGILGFFARTIFSTGGNDGELRIANNALTGFSRLTLGLAGGATSRSQLQKKVTGIADNSATDIITVTVPNANHAATVKVYLTCSTGSTDAFESTRTAEGSVAIARTTGVATVAGASTLEQAQIATVSGGATLTLAYQVSAMTGAVGATQTFTIQVVTNDSGNVGSNQCVVVSEVINAETTGITIA